MCAWNASAGSAASASIGSQAIRIKDGRARGVAKSMFSLKRFNSISADLFLSEHKWLFSHLLFLMEKNLVEGGWWGRGEMIFFRWILWVVGIYSLCGSCG